VRDVRDVRRERYERRERCGDMRYMRDVRDVRDGLDTFTEMTSQNNLSFCLSDWRAFRHTGLYNGRPGGAPQTNSFSFENLFYLFEGPNAVHLHIYINLTQALELRKEKYVPASDVTSLKANCVLEGNCSPNDIARLIVRTGFQLYSD
jgi:hypothetical protein